MPVEAALPEPEGIPAEVLLRRIEALEARVAALEHPFSPAEPKAAEAPEGPEAPPEFAPLAALGLAGQVCLILAGAFFIRMVTDSGTLPRGLGVGLGLAYAAFWAFRADRSQHGTGAAFFVSASALIAFPLLWEATTKFQVFGPWAAAFTLLGITVGLMAVAWRKVLEGLAWVITLGALSEGIALMAATTGIEAFATLFLVLGAGSLWLTYGRRWQGLRWPVALAADGVILVLTVLVAWPGGPPEFYRGLSPMRAMLLALGLVLAYLGSISVRILMRQRQVIPFVVFQAALVLAIGFGGAVRVAQATGSGAALLGASAVIAGLGCYGVAFAFLEREKDGALNFTFFTGLALVLIFVGCPILLGGNSLALTWTVMGLLAAEVGARTQRNTLLVHGAGYLLAASFVSGLISVSAKAFLALDRGHGWPFGPMSLTVLVTLLLVHAHMVNRRLELGLWFQRLPSFTVGLLGILGLGGLCFTLFLRGLGALGMEPGVAAAIRTLVLTALAIGLASLSRFWPRSELRWLVYPVLAATGLKLLLEDMAHGRASMLFLAFACFGVALLLAPRLLRESPPSERN